MPRPPRIHEEGLCYHITQRGNAQKQIFFDDFDRAKFCELMKEGVERFDHRIHAFCLMDNHFHLLIQAGIKPIGKALQNMTFRHAKRLNTKFETKGHQFQGRYYAGVIEDEESFLQVLRYIHQNPIRANMVSRVGDYRWSSHKHYSSRINLPWVEKNFGLSLFSPDLSKATKSYLEFMEEPVDEVMIDKIKAKSSEYVIGKDGFMKKIEQLSKKIIELPHIDIQELSYLVCNFYGVNQESIMGQFCNHKSNFIRGVIGYIISNHSQQSLSSFAQYTGKSLSSVSRATQKVTNKLIIDHDLEIKYSIDSIIQKVKNTHIFSKLHQ